MTNPTTAPTITGVSHIDLTVTDLDRSEAFYAELFGMSRALDARNDDHHFASRSLFHPDSGLIVGLVRHDRHAGDFDERRCGLDHLSLDVSDRTGLDAWVDRLDERGIDHSPVSESETWDVVVFRDPDDIQLELFVMKPAAARLLTG